MNPLNRSDNTSTPGHVDLASPCIAFRGSHQNCRCTRHSHHTLTNVRTGISNRIDNQLAKLATPEIANFSVANSNSTNWYEPPSHEMVDNRDGR